MNDLTMVKRTVRLYESDLELAKKFYKHVGYNHILRLLLHRHLIRLENAVREREANIAAGMTGYCEADQKISNEILILQGASDGTEII